MTSFPLSVCLGEPVMCCWPVRPSLPTPNPNSLASLSVFSWYSFLVEQSQTQAVYLLQLMEFSLADENNLGEGAAPKLGPPAQRKPEWKVKSATAPGAPIVRIKRTFTSTTTSSPQKQETGFRLLTSFQNENETAFNFPPPTQRMQWTVKQNTDLQALWPEEMFAPSDPLIRNVQTDTKEWDSNVWIKPKYKKRDLITFRSGRVVSITAGLWDVSN